MSINNYITSIFVKSEWGNSFGRTNFGENIGTNFGKGDKFKQKKTFLLIRGDKLRQGRVLIQQVLINMRGAEGPGL